MSMLADIRCGVKEAGSFYGGPSSALPTLDDLMIRVGSDFAYTANQQREIQDKIRGVQALPGNSVATPLAGIRGAIGAGLRALADRYFTPAPLSQNNIPGYRRIGI
jgi:hypothetical protein